MTDLPTVSELQNLRREGAKARREYGAPRGTREKAAEEHTPKSKPDFDVDLLAEALRQTDRGTAWLEAAIAVLGEYGGARHISPLGSALIGGSATVQIAASYALAAIGGPGAENFLLDAVSCTGFSPDVRLGALTALLDMTTGGYDTYVATNRRASWAPRVKNRLEALKDDPRIGTSILSVLEKLD